jgi:oligosaccharide repeat unit polymerase
MWLPLFFSAALFIICISEFRKGGTTYFPLYIVANLLFIYVFTPIVNYYLEIGNHKYFIEYFDDSTVVFYAALIVLLFSIFFYVGIKFTKTNHDYYIKVSNKLDGKKYIFSIFFISVASFFAYVFFTGQGLQYVFANATTLRSGTDEAKNFGAAFLKLFTYYIEIVVFYFFAKISFSKKTEKPIVVIAFLITLGLAVTKSFADGGRGGMINLIVGLIFIAIVSERFKYIPKFKLFLALIVAVFIGLYGKTYIFQIINADARNVNVEISEIEIISGVVVEYSHQFSSLLMAVDRDLGMQRWYMDFFIWILKPLKLLGIEIADSISYFNTYHATGVWDSEIPPGLVALNYYQGGIVGVMIGGFASGYMVKFIDKLLLNTISQNKNIFSVAICSIFFIYVPFIFVNSDPALFVQWIFAYSLIFLTFFLVKKMRVKKIIIN